MASAFSLGRLKTLQGTNVKSGPFLVSEPEEAHVDDERDEQHGCSGHLGVDGARVEVFGVAAVLFGHAG